jgi:hypothetical protein
MSSLTRPSNATSISSRVGEDTSCQARPLRLRFKATCGPIFSFAHDQSNPAAGTPALRTASLLNEPTSAAFARRQKCETNPPRPSGPCGRSCKAKPHAWGGTTTFDYGTNPPLILRCASKTTERTPLAPSIYPAPQPHIFVGACPSECYNAEGRPSRGRRHLLREWHEARGQHQPAV